MMQTSKIIISMLFAQVLTLLGFASYAVTLTTLQNEWGLSNFQSGMIASFFFFGYIGFVSLATVLTDRIDARKIYLFGISIEFIGLLGFGLFANGFYSALFFMFFIGAGVSGTYMPGLKILTDRIKKGELTRYISFYTAFFGVGVGLSYIISGFLLQQLNWHYVFGMISIGPICAGIFVYFFIPALMDVKWNKNFQFSIHDFFPINRWKLVWKNKQSLYYIFGYVVHSLELFASRSWLVAFFLICISQSRAPFFFNATESAGLINFLGVPASIIGNEIAIRIGRQKLIHIAMLVSAIFGVCLSLSIGSWWWIILFFAIGHSIFIMVDSATLTAGMVTSTPDDLKGSAMGLHSILGFSGGLLGPSIFGYILDVSGGQHQASAWVWAYASIVIWGCFFVMYHSLSKIRKNSS